MVRVDGAGDVVQLTYYGLSGQTAVSTASAQVGGLPPSPTPTPTPTATPLPDIAFSRPSFLPGQRAVFYVTDSGPEQPVIVYGEMDRRRARRRDRGTRSLLGTSSPASPRRLPTGGGAPAAVWSRLRILVRSRRYLLPMAGPSVVCHGQRSGMPSLASFT